MKQQIERARELLSMAKHVAIATVNADGTPHNTPLYQNNPYRIVGDGRTSADSHDMFMLNIRARTRRDYL